MGGHIEKIFRHETPKIDAKKLKIVMGF